VSIPGGPSLAQPRVRDQTSPRSRQGLDKPVRLVLSNVVDYDAAASGLLGASICFGRMVVMAERFFSHVPLELGCDIELDANQSHHLLHVMRAKVGDAIVLFDGSPRSFHGRVLSTGRRSVRVMVDREAAAAPRPHSIGVASAVPKGDRVRFLVEKVTELGGGAFLPLQTARTANPWSRSSQKKAEQWTVEACKQALRNEPLAILAPCGLEAFLSKYSSGATLWIACTPEDSQRLGAEASGNPRLEGTDSGDAGVTDDPSRLARADGLDLSEIPARPESIDTPDMSSTFEVNAPQQWVMIGPEGGWTPAELDLAARYGARPLSLPPYVLRIETAAIASLVRLSQASE
jgi:16S rRNA (uracil1498-N3)-methyltransferase